MKVSKVVMVLGTFELEEREEAITALHRSARTLVENDKQHDMGVSLNRRAGVYYLELWSR